MSFGLRLRIPGWCDPNVGASLTINGKPVALPASASYAEIRRVWRPGDVVRMHLPMPARRIESIPTRWKTPAAWR